jgi:BNR/Asp-box repeat
MSSSPARLYGTTGTSFVRLDEGTDGWAVTPALPDSGAQCLALDPADPDTVYVGHASGGVSKTTDGGATWSDSRLAEQQVFSVAVGGVDGAVYAGTEPSSLFRSDDGGETWTELEGLLELPSRPTWSFPPRPWTSHVRWIAPSPHDADVLLAGIELGGLMRSSDRGESWEDHRPGAQRDVHSLAWHPHAVGHAYQAGGGGAAWSDDGGETWRPADDGRDRHYTWSVAVDPEDPDLWYVSASTGPFAAHGRGDPQAYVYRRRNDGWDRLAGGLPEPLPSMPCALVATAERLLAGFASGELWESRDRGDTWRTCSLEPGITRLQALVAAPR